MQWVPVAVLASWLITIPEFPSPSVRGVCLCCSAADPRHSQSWHCVKPWPPLCNNGVYSGRAESSCSEKKERKKEKLGAPKQSTYQPSSLLPSQKTELSVSSSQWDLTTRVPFHIVKKTHWASFSSSVSQSHYGSLWRCWVSVQARFLIPASLGWGAQGLFPCAACPATGLCRKVAKWITEGWGPNQTLRWRL